MQNIPQDSNTYHDSNDHEYNQDLAQGLLDTPESER